MDIMLAHLLIKLNTYMLCVSTIFSCLSFFTVHFPLYLRYWVKRIISDISTLLFNQPKLIYQCYNSNRS